MTDFKTKFILQVLAHRSGCRYQVIETSHCGVVNVCIDVMADKTL